MAVAYPTSPSAHAVPHPPVDSPAAPAAATPRRALRLVHVFLAGWIVGGALLIALAPRPDVERTQEARVLATAREMLARGTVRDWLVPHLNDKPRLQKPPLAYWITATSFAALGVSDFSGRLPAALAAWLTVGVTFAAARRAFGTRAAACAAAALFGSVIFVRHGTLAETDVWAALFSTVAIAAMWRCFDDGDESDAPPMPTPTMSPPMSRLHFAFWAHASGAAIGLLALAKGPPALFPLLFLLAAAAVRRRWDVPRRWLLYGAPATALLVAAPWFAYIASVPEAPVLWHELRVVAGGGGHRRSFLIYFVDLLVVTAPWTGVTLLALAAGVRRARREPRVALALVWFAVVFVPLCFVGQKQRHYLMPAAPPLAMLTGWLLDRAVRWWLAEGRGRDEHADADADVDELARDPFVRAVRPVLAVTLCAAVLAVVALPVGGRLVRHRVDLLHDVAPGVAIALTGVAGLWLMRPRRGRGTSAAAAAALLALAALPALALVLLFWSPSLHHDTYRGVAATLHRDREIGHPNARYAFYAQPENLPLCWAMRRVIPTLQTSRDVHRAAASAAAAGTTAPVLITASSRAGDNPVPPPPYVEHYAFEVDARPVTVYVAGLPPRPADPSQTQADLVERP